MADRSKLVIDMADRSKLVSLNNEIGQLGKRKDLAQAMVLLNQAVEEGIANSHTYAAAMNANILCGSVSGAETVMEEMINRGRKRDIINCTIMLKGYCGDGRLSKAFALFDSMLTKSPIVMPNIRTVNTLLRGCITTGNIDRAEYLQKLTATKVKAEVTPDVSFWEYLVALSCQGLKLDKALPMVGRLKGDESMSSGLVNMHLNIARAAAILGDWSTCKKSLSFSDSFLKSEGISGSSSGINNDNDDNNDKTVVVGGKRAWKSTNGERESDSRADSLAMFREHSKEETLLQISLIEGTVEMLGCC
jgi:pentatricopeptide repeat protein